MRHRHPTRGYFKGQSVLLRWGLAAVSWTKLIWSEDCRPIWIERDAVRRLNFWAAFSDGHRENRKLASFVMNLQAKPVFKERLESQPVPSEHWLSAVAGAPRLLCAGFRYCQDLVSVGANPSRSSKDVRGSDVVGLRDDELQGRVPGKVLTGPGIAVGSLVRARGFPRNRGLDRCHIEPELSRGFRRLTK